MKTIKIIVCAAALAALCCGCFASDEESAKLQKMLQDKYDAFINTSIPASPVGAAIEATEWYQPDTVPAEYTEDMRIYTTVGYVSPEYEEYYYGIYFYTKGALRPSVQAYEGYCSDVFSEMLIRKGKAFTDRLKLKDTVKIGNGFVLRTYDISTMELKKQLTADSKNNLVLDFYKDDFQVLYEGDTVIWSTAVYNVLAAAAMGGSYMVVTEKNVIYISFDGEKRIARKYLKNFMNNAYDEKPDPIKAEILTDNIVKITYADGSMTHWRIRQTWDDCVKNVKAYKGLSAQDMDRSVVWYSGQIVRGMSVGRSSEDYPFFGCANLAWDCAPEGSPEPTYDK